MTELPVLDAAEQRVLGSLLEKEVTVPASYPMTLNSIRLACNQTSSREPVVDFTEDEVQQTLRALIDWSWDLCTGPERRLWSRLSVFSGGFELDAAEQVGAAPPLEAGSILDLIGSLVYKSVIFRVGSPKPNLSPEMCLMTPGASISAAG